MTPIGELDLPARTKGALIRAGFYSVEQLRAVPLVGPDRFDFRHLKGIGYKGEIAIYAVLNALPTEADDAVVPSDDEDEAWPFVPDHPFTKDEREREILKFCAWLLDEGAFLCVPRLDSGEWLPYRFWQQDDPRNTRNTRMTEVQPEDIPDLLGLWKAWEEDRAVADAERRAEGG